MLRTAISALGILAACVLLAAERSWAAGQASPAKAPDTVLFGFEKEADVKNWSALRDPGAKSEDPAATVEWSSEGAPGSHALKITFKGGLWPAITTSTIPVTDWTPFNAVKVDVTVGRPCVVGFRAYSDKKAAADPDAHWEKTVFLEAGRSSRILPFKTTPKFSGTKMMAVDVYMYQPRPGENILVGGFTLANVKPHPPADMTFSVLGSDLKVKDPADLAAKIKDMAPKPEPASVEQVETDFKAKYEELRKAHPRALLALFRDGEKGWDPVNPEKAYNGWKDSTIHTHPPDADLLHRSRKFGRAVVFWSYSRNTVARIMQADLAVIPRGSTILSAQLMLLRRGKESIEQEPHPVTSMFVAEPCNRDWDETEVNAYQYAVGKVWKELAGANWIGDDPDSVPTYVAYGQSQGNINTWDFTEAVKFWTDGAHTNRGFFWYDQYGNKDFPWRAAPTRRAAQIKDRPALMVIYESKR